MQAHTRLVAVDLGAESGRVVVGDLGEGRFALTTVHRFANAPVALPDGLHWDIVHLYRNILAGLEAAAALAGPDISSVGIDSWAIDYGLLDGAGHLLGLPYSYRDSRTDGVAARVAATVPPSAQYARTGIAHLPFNTIYQLAAQARAGDVALAQAHTLLLIPDLLHFWLTGERATEYTNATTTAALGLDGAWATDLLAPLGIPTHLLLPPSAPGTVLGGLRRAVCDASGLTRARVILPATHDTASAVVAMPATERRSAAYISSGTWSLLGLELDQPVATPAAHMAGFTNEGGVQGTYRFLTNIMGLWLLQECRRSWARAGHDWSYSELTAHAQTIASPRVVIHVDHPAFLHPADMPTALAEYLAATGQVVPEHPFLLVRAILDNLALAYRLALLRAEQASGERVRTIYVLGGGAQNALLCQMTADACARPVVAGPAEATAMGNVLVQAMGLGVLPDLPAARALVRSSTEMLTYTPRRDGLWDDLAGRLTRVISTQPDVRVE